MKKFFFFFIVLCNCSSAQTWSAVGSPNFVDSSYNGRTVTADMIFCAVAPNGEPYVVYRDNSQLAMGTVKKFNGSKWIAVGSHFSAGDAYCTTMAFDKYGTPYVAYTDLIDTCGNATVMKFDGSNWIAVGSPGFTPGSASYTSIAIDSNGTPYVAFRDQGSCVYSSWPNGYRASVMKFDGTNWVYVGTPGFSTVNGAAGALYTSLAIDANGTLYIAYSDFSNNFKATVMKFDGISWINVGAGVISSGGASSTSIVIDSQGAPYVAYSDGANADKATVMKFNGSNWLPVGAAAGLSPGAVDYTSLSIDKNDRLYLAFKDYSHYKKGASVMTFNGSNWVYIGTPGFSDSTALNTTIAIDKNKGILYTAYETVYNEYNPPAQYNATVMKFDISNITTVLPNPVIINDSVPPTKDTMPITTIIKDTVPKPVVTVFPNPLSTNIQQTENNNSFSVFPNPTGNCITVCVQNTNPTDAFTLRVTNALSEIIYSEEINNASASLNVTTNGFTKQIDLSQLPKGIYFVELQPTVFSTSHNTTKRNIAKLILQ